MSSVEGRVHEISEASGLRVVASPQLRLVGVLRSPPTVAKVCFWRVLVMTMVMQDCGFCFLFA